MKQNVSLNFQPPSTLVFVFFSPIKIVLLTFVNDLSICQPTKFHDPILTDARFASTSEEWTFAISEWLKVWD
jgi:hypothetical protein